jgi:hypothetical protein
MYGIVKQLFNLAIKRLCFAIKILICLLLSLPAVAAVEAKERPLGDWRYRLGAQSEDNKCMIYTQAMRNKSTSSETRETEPYLYIIKKRPQGYSLGLYCAALCPDGVSLEIAGRNYDLAGYLGDYAVTYSSIQDVAIINQLLKAQDMVKVRSVDEGGNVFLDYYSLDGFTDALKSLNLCILNK